MKFLFIYFIKLKHKSEENYPLSLTFETMVKLSFTYLLLNFSLSTKTENYINKINLTEYFKKQKRRNFAIIILAVNFAVIKSIISAI